MILVDIISEGKLYDLEPYNDHFYGHEILENPTRSQIKQFITRHSYTDVRVLVTHPNNIVYMSVDSIHDNMFEALHHNGLALSEDDFTKCFISFTSPDEMGRFSGEWADEMVQLSDKVWACESIAHRKGPVWERLRNNLRIIKWD